MNHPDLSQLIHVVRDRRVMLDFDLAAENRELLAKLELSKERVDKHDVEIGGLIDAIRTEFVVEEAERPRKIGFKP